MRREVSMHGKAQHPRAEVVRMRTARTCRRPQVLESLLTGQRHWIMNRRRHTCLLKMAAQMVAFGSRHDEQMVIAPACLLLNPEREFRERRSVDCRYLAPAAVSAVETLQLDAEDRGLKFIQPAVVTRYLGGIVLPLTIVPQQS